ncbi:MAG: hypothetical protein J0M05_13630 [Candidatus Kapabacteria bacterium]|nr:hypothetical protein [Candidatus Kapabacteria bacterium]
MEVVRRSNSIFAVVACFLTSYFTFWGCSSVPSGNEFGTDMCDCVVRAKGNREVFNQCVSALSQQAVPFFNKNGVDSNQARRTWKKQMVTSSRGCQEELRTMGIDLDAIEEDWTKKR